MTDGDALLAAILANRDDDSVRLVYADWLQENGEEERAEFIRVQVELTSDPKNKYGCRECTSPAVVNPAFSEEECCCRYRPLYASSNELLALHGDEWVPHCSAMWGWERGFVGHIRGIYAADWLAHANAILAQHPVRKVKLTTAPPCTQYHNETLGGPPYRVLEASWSHDGEPFMFTEDGQLKAELQRKWGIEFELPAFSWWTSGGPVADFVPPAPISDESFEAFRAAGERLAIEREQAVLNALFNAPFDTTGHAQAANYAAAKASEQAWNAIVGGILENMIVQDGMLPGGDDEADEDEDDTDVVTD